MEKILVLDFGGQYDQLIARNVRELHVYAEIIPYDQISVDTILQSGYKGIILTGGPNAVYEETAPHYDCRILEAGIPVLGICYGAQLLAYMAGGEVSAAGQTSEYGKINLRVSDSDLLREIPEESVCWMSHTDHIHRVPEGFRIIARTDHCPCAAMEDTARHLYGVQFHPEVTHTEYGRQVFRNFLYRICRCKGDWSAEDFAAQAIERYRKELAGKKVLLALSGGVDSSVVGALLHQAIGKDLICVFVDHGLLRKNEGDMVETTFRDQMGMNLIRINAQDRFLQKLKGITEPERKRKIIGEEFIRVFEEEAQRIGHVDILAQGTIYPDIIESGKGDSAVIKSHHNVGGLPDTISFDETLEPLRNLFKDEVRNIGTMLGLPDELVWRQPFPGPGLAVRIIGEITQEKIRLLQDADAIFREEVSKVYPEAESGPEAKSGPEAETGSEAEPGPEAESGTEAEPAQYFAVLTDTRSVGVMGDARTYGYVAALRAVTTSDFMTADWTRLPYELLARASSRITNEVKGISRVVYDITSKPPGTVEWE